VGKTPTLKIKPSVTAYGYNLNHSESRGRSGRPQFKVSLGK
jgi:hypothetical protein